MNEPPAAAPTTGWPAWGLLSAIQFLTRVPLRLRSAPDLGHAVPWFPVAGGIIGATVGGVAVGMMELVPPLVAAAIAVLFGVVLTGAFHEDGLADTADALGGWSPEQRREILKDSRHGSYGVAAMCGSIVLRITCVAALGPAVAFASLVAAHTIGRGAAVAVMGLASPVPEQSLGADYSRALSPQRATAGVAAAVAIAALSVGWWAGPFVSAAACGALAVAVVARRAFGRVSGDILGAVEQVAECLVLVVATGLALRHPLWWA
jgi:adenosylcobinamide-GDP ribazoletransferase